MRSQEDKVSFVISLLILPVIILSILNTNLLFLLVSYGLIFLILLSALKLKVVQVDTELALGIGYANIITVFRELIFLILIFYRSSISPVVFSLAIGGILLSDKFDGEVARKLNEESVIGGTLDIEADSSITVLMILVLIFDNVIPSWIITIGMLRYIYVIVLFVWQNNKPSKRSFISAFVSISFNIGLLTIWTVRNPVLIIITIMLGISIVFTFLKDFLYRIK